MHSTSVLLLTGLSALAALSGCTPQHAEVTGAYTAWLATGSSETALQQVLDPEEALLYDCDHMPPHVTDVVCADIDPDWLYWLRDDSFFVYRGELDPWRTEAIITSEGDFQLTIHNRLSNGADFRVAMVIDSSFAPTKCDQDENGDAYLAPVDDADWVTEWSADEDGMFIYYLNAGAYQLSPYDDSGYWSLPDEWLSGYGHAKFAEDEFVSRPSDYGVYRDNVSPVGYDDETSWYVSLDPDAPDWEEYDEEANNIRTMADAWETEVLEQHLGPADYQLKVEDNKWRAPDTSTSGLDGWIQLDSSWVRVDKRDLVAGDTVSGDFQIQFEAVESQSGLVVTGTFKVEEIKEDKWGYPVLDDQKQEENDTPTCE